MALFVIGDLHLSFGCQKPMNIFDGWENHAQRLEYNWRRLVRDGDTVVLPGDLSWAMDLNEALPDFRFLQSLPGKKVILKGNHDYWWPTVSKLEDFFCANGLDSFLILYNCGFFEQGMWLCGTRGWLFEKGEPHDEKILSREAGRLRRSLDNCAGKEGERVVFLHYPPVFGQEENLPIINVLLEYGVKRVYYGHVHGAGCAYALNGVYRGINFRLISSDYLGFCPLKIEKI